MHPIANNNGPVVPRDPKKASFNESGRVEDAPEVGSCAWSLRDLEHPSTICASVWSYRERGPECPLWPVDGTEYNGAVRCRDEILSHQRSRNPEIPVLCSIASHGRRCSEYKERKEKFPFALFAFFCGKN